MIDVRCGSCAVLLRLDDALAGKKARCPKCQAVSVVPAPGAAPTLVIPGVIFCDGCGGSIGPSEVRREASGKTLCSYCITAEEEARPKTEARSILEEAGLDIPGAVVLTGREERTMGRIAQDSAARRDYERRASRQAAGDAESVLEAFLVEKGFVDQETIDKVKQFRDRSGKGLVWALDSLEVMSEEEVAWRMAEASGLKHALDKVLAISDDVADLLPADTIRARKILPLRREEGYLVVALVNPLDAGILREVEAVAGLPLRPIVCTETCFRTSFDQAGLGTQT